MGHIWDPPDVGIGQQFLAPKIVKTQNYNNAIFKRSVENKMVIKQEKSNYMVVKDHLNLLSLGCILMGLTLKQRKKLFT